MDRNTKTEVIHPIQGGQHAQQQQTDLTSVEGTPEVTISAAARAIVDEHRRPAITGREPEPTTVIPADVRQLLAELEMLSHGAVASWSPAPGGSRAVRLLPPGERQPPHVRLRAQYVAALSDVRRALVVGWMRSALEEARGRSVDRSQVRLETADQLAARIVRDGEGVILGEASVHFRCTPTMVRRARLAADRDPELGRRVTSPAPAASAQDRVDRAEVLRLRALGLSVRAIAMRTGVPRSTVHEWVVGRAV